MQVLVKRISEYPWLHDPQFTVEASKHVKHSSEHNSHVAVIEFGYSLLSHSVDETHLPSFK